MKKIKDLFRKVASLQWYYQILLAILALLSTYLLYKFLLWFIPIILAIFSLLLIYTDGEFLTMIWEKYKQSKETTVFPLSDKTNFYHWLSEEGVRGLPLNTKKFTQGIEWDSIKESDVYYIHLKKSLSESELANLEVDIRQRIVTVSNDQVDAIISQVDKTPFKAIKIRLITSSEANFQEQQLEEDF
ncbi:hypothetical protein [Streptococcus pluranimalium]|uniref:hypothetical protein n=1 Tax=Streptococcus pluranimalium TaxID=82348 RepID=UPI00313A066D